MRSFEAHRGHSGIVVPAAGTNRRVCIYGALMWSLLGWDDVVEEAFFDLEATVAAGSFVDFVLGNNGAGSLTGDESILEVEIGRFEMLLGAGLPGDANFDGVVDGQDFTILKAHYGLSGVGWQGGDFNSDGLIDGQDFSLLKANYGKGTPSAIPEPATLTLLALGGLALLRRRSR